MKKKTYILKNFYKIFNHKSVFIYNQHKSLKSKDFKKLRKELKIYNLKMKLIHNNLFNKLYKENFSNSNKTHLFDNNLLVIYSNDEIENFSFINKLKLSKSLTFLTHLYSQKNYVINSESLSKNVTFMDTLSNLNNNIRFTPLLYLLVNLLEYSKNSADVT